MARKFFLLVGLFLLLLAGTAPAQSVDARKALWRHLQRPWALANLEDDSSTRRAAGSRKSARRTGWPKLAALTKFPTTRA